MDQLFTYGIIGKLPSFWSSGIRKIWSVAARFTYEEAEAYLKVLNEQATAFVEWKMRMIKNNYEGTREDIEAEYIEKHMLDKHFELNVQYEILCFPST